MWFFVRGASQDMAATLPGNSRITLYSVDKAKTPFLFLLLLLSAFISAAFF